MNIKNFDGHKQYAHKLLKSLYGLKQSGRNWQILLEDMLMKIGFEKWVDIQCVMRKFDKYGNVIVIIGYFVDDLVIAGQKEHVKQNMDDIKMTFKCTVTDFNDEGKKNILGIDVLIKDDKIELDQSKYITKLGERFGIDGKNYLTPIEPGFYFKHAYRELDFNTRELNDKIKYLRQLIGALLDPTFNMQSITLQDMFLYLMMT